LGNPGIRHSTSLESLIRSSVIPKHYRNWAPGRKNFLNNRIGRQPEAGRYYAGEFLASQSRYGSRPSLAGAGDRAFASSNLVLNHQTKLQRFWSAVQNHPATSLFLTVTGILVTGTILSIIGFFIHKHLQDKYGDQNAPMTGADLNVTHDFTRNLVINNYNNGSDVHSAQFNTMVNDLVANTQIVLELEATKKALNGTLSTYFQKQLTEAGKRVEEIQYILEARKRRREVEEGSGKKVEEIEDWVSELMDPTLDVEEIKVGADGKIVLTPAQQDYLYKNYYSHLNFLDKKFANVTKDV
jgi:hypothetical protein